MLVKVLVTYSCIMRSSVHVPVYVCQENVFLPSHFLTFVVMLEGGLPIERILSVDILY